MILHHVQQYLGQSLISPLSLLSLLSHLFSIHLVPIFDVVHHLIPPRKILSDGVVARWGSKTNKTKIFPEGFFTFFSFYVLFSMYIFDLFSFFLCFIFNGHFQHFFLSVIFFNVHFRHFFLLCLFDYFFDFCNSFPSLPFSLSIYLSMSLFPSVSFFSLSLLLSLFVALYCFSINFAVTSFYNLVYFLHVTITIFHYL